MANRPKIEKKTFVLDSKKPTSSIKKSLGSKDGIEYSAQIKRRISFSGRKLVREFSGTEEAQTWKASYEMTDQSNNSELSTHSTSHQMNLTTARSACNKENNPLAIRPKISLSATTDFIEYSQQMSVLRFENSMDLSLMEHEKLKLQSQGYGGNPSLSYTTVQPSKLKKIRDKSLDSSEEELEMLCDQQLKTLDFDDGDRNDAVNNQLSKNRTMHECANMELTMSDDTLIPPKITKEKSMYRYTSEDVNPIYEQTNIGNDTHDHHHPLRDKYNTILQSETLCIDDDEELQPPKRLESSRTKDKTIVFGSNSDSASMNTTTAMDKIKTVKTSTSAIRLNFGECDDERSFSFLGVSGSNLSGLQHKFTPMKLKQGSAIRSAKPREQQPDSEVDCEMVEHTAGASQNKRYVRYSQADEMQLNHTSFLANAELSDHTILQCVPQPILIPNNNNDLHVDTIPSQDTPVNCKETLEREKVLLDMSELKLSCMKSNTQFLTEDIDLVTATEPLRNKGQSDLLNHHNAENDTMEISIATSTALCPRLFSAKKNRQTVFLQQDMDLEIANDNMKNGNDVVNVANALQTFKKQPAEGQQGMIIPCDLDVEKGEIELEMDSSSDIEIEQLGSGTISQGKTNVNEYLDMATPSSQFRRCYLTPRHGIVATPHRSLMEFEQLERLMQIDLKEMEALEENSPIKSDKCRKQKMHLKENHRLSNYVAMPIIAITSDSPPLEMSEATATQHNRRMEKQENRRMATVLTPNFPSAKRRQTVFTNNTMIESSMVQSLQDNNVRKHRQTIYPIDAMHLTGTTLQFSISDDDDADHIEGESIYNIAGLITPHLKLHDCNEKLEVDAMMGGSGKNSMLLSPSISISNEKNATLNISAEMEQSSITRKKENDDIDANEISVLEPDVPEMPATSLNVSHKTLNDESNSPPSSKSFIEMSDTTRFRIDIATLSAGLSEIDKTHLSLVDNTLTELSCSHNCDEDTLGDYNATLKNADSIVVVCDETIPCARAQALHMSNMSNEELKHPITSCSSHRKCKFCEHTFINDHTIEGSPLEATFALPKVSLLSPLEKAFKQQMKLQRRGPTLANVHEYIECLSLRRSLELDNTTLEISSIGANSENIDPIHMKGNSADSLIAAFKSEFGNLNDIHLPKVEFQMPRSFFERLEDRVKNNKKRCNFSFDNHIELNGKPSMLFLYHRKVTTFYVSINYEETTKFGEEIRIIAAKLNHVAIKETDNPQPISYILDFQMKVALIIDVYTQEIVNNLDSIYNVLQKLDSVCQRVYSHSMRLWRIVCRKQASLQRDSIQPYVRKIVRRPVLREGIPSDIEEIEFRINVFDIDYICYEHIVMPPIHLFHENIQLLPSGFSFLENFLSDPIQHLRNRNVYA